MNPRRPHVPSTGSSRPRHEAPRRPHRATTTTLALGLALALASLASAANQIVNGDFESPWVTSTRGWDVYYAGQSFPGWTVGAGSVDVVRIVAPNQGEAWSAASGQQSVDLNGFGPGSIYQDVVTTPGQAYFLSFALAGNVVGGPLVVRMDFLWQQDVVETLTFDVAHHDGYDVGWTYYQYALTAPLESASTRLVFESLSATGSRGPALDDIILGTTPRAGIPVTSFPPGGDPFPVPDRGPTWLLGLLALAPLLSWARRLPVDRAVT